MYCTWQTGVTKTVQTVRIAARTWRVLEWRDDVKEAVGGPWEADAAPAITPQSWTQLISTVASSVSTDVRPGMLWSPPRLGITINPDASAHAAPSSNNHYQTGGKNTTRHFMGMSYSSRGILILPVAKVYAPVQACLWIRRRVGAY